MRHATTRCGLTLLEVMVVVLLIGFALIPLMNLGRSTHRQAFFTEHHLIAMGRARLILDLACALDFEVLDALAAKAGGAQTPLNMDQILGAGTLNNMFGAEGQAVASVYELKFKDFTHDVRFVKLEKDLGRVDVDVRWTFVADRPGLSHTVSLSRFISRREQGVRLRYALQ